MAGRILSEDLEAVRERADIVEVIGGYTQLRKAGRIFKGLCVFHQEKTPSLTVDPDKRLYYCFGCGTGGDVFKFIKDTEGLSFTETIERLAARFGVTLHYERGDGRDAGAPRRALLAAVAEAASFYSNVLMASPEGEGGRRHLEGRGFSSDDAAEWRLGQSPAAGDALHRHLLSKKFTVRQIEDAGLVLTTESGQRRDRFRGRLMFPVADSSGELVGFGARALGAEQPKYLNSPEGVLYHKARILYGLDRARREISSASLAVVTEGYTDVIALHRVGVKTAVATCGTALGEEHLALLKRFCDRVVLAFDADAAGSLASERAFGAHSRLGLEVLVAPIPAGKDPADVALTEGGDAIRSIIDGATPLMQFVLEAEIVRHRLDTADGKARAVRAAAGLLAWEPNRVARGEHAFWVARRVGVDETLVQREMAEIERAPGSRETVRTPIRQPGHVRLEREVLGILLKSPGLLSDGRLSEEHFTQPENRLLFRALAGAEPAEPGALMDRLPDDASRSLAAELALTPPVSTDVEEVFSRLEAFRLRRKIEDLRTTLEHLDSSTEEYEQRFKELMALEDQRRGLESG